MKIGTKVDVCHDGKFGRRCPGVVIATKNGYKIKVRADHPVIGTFEFWARRMAPIRYRRQRSGSCIVYTRRPVYFGGWADVDWFCPWFSVLKAD